MEALHSASGIATSINFMGCYAAVHALKLALALAAGGEGIQVLIVCTELWTLAFRQQPTLDNMLSKPAFFGRLGGGADHLR